MNELNHISVIMDGHRRWAKNHNKTIISGHMAGADKLFEACKWCIEQKVSYFSVYAFSVYNWNRDSKEVNNLILLLNDILSKKMEMCIDHGIKVKIIGDVEKFPEATQRLLSKIEQKSKHGDRLNLIIAIGYGGREEIIYGIKRLISENVNVNDVTVQKFNSFLYLPNMPMVDLLIRPGGHRRLSDYMLWEIADAEIRFVEKYWPDFTYSDFIELIEDYRNEKIKHGK